MVSTVRVERTMLMRTQESSEISSPSSTVHREEAQPIVIDGRDYIYSLAVLVDGKHVVSGDGQGKIPRWCIEDGKEVGTPMNAGSRVYDIAVSRDGRLIVSGTKACSVTVWNAETRSKVTEFKAHGESVRAVDVSLDATKIATGSSDKTACVWSLSTGEKLLGPLKHDNSVVATKFSPDGHLFATATFIHNSVRIYDSRNGSLLVEVPVKVGSQLNQSLAWASDSKQLFALSHDGYIHRVHVSAKTTLSKWLIHGTNGPGCIVLASNGTFVAASAGSSVSLWDATTHEQIGAVIECTHGILSMAISSNYDLVTSGDKKITFRALRDTLPPHYKSPSIQELLNQRAESQQARQERDSLIQSLRTQEESSNSKIARLEKTNQELCIQLADAQRRADGINYAHEQMHQCQSLYAQGRIQGAVECLVEFANVARGDVGANKFIIDWVAEFTQRCIAALESVGDEALNADKRDEAIAAYSTALSLGPTVPNAVTCKWANMILKRGSALEALSAANKFKVPRFVVYRVICDILEQDSRLAEAVECFLQMQSELPEDAGVRDERAEWELDFKARCMKALEKSGDVAMDSAAYEDAVVHYSTVLSLDPLSAVLLTKRSKARDGSLQVANAAIKRHRQLKMERWAEVKWDPPQRVDHTTTSVFGTVEIKTTEDLSRPDNLVLVHPLLYPGLPFEDDAKLFTPVDMDSGARDPDTPLTNLRFPSSYTAISSHHAPLLNKYTRALRLLAGLRQRVASDHPLVVQLLKGISPRYLAQKIRTPDIL
ncbi:WD40-repeat-containing domain protein [Boletus coccyginus]|nr:WD40-repeat-containing domain protein [Boletus coccyginus]